MKFLFLLPLLALAACSTMPVKHTEVTWPQGQCLPNSQRFQAAFNEQIGGWSRIIIVSYQDHASPGGLFPAAHPNPLAKPRTDLEPQSRHAIVACEYKDRIWVYDDAVLGSPYPLRVQNVSKNDANRIAYWTNQPNFKSASFDL